MKKTAQKKVSIKSRSIEKKVTLDSLQTDEVKIPPDILGDPLTEESGQKESVAEVLVEKNGFEENEIEHTEAEKVFQESPAKLHEGNDDDASNISKPSFYERVTGEKPAFQPENSDEELVDEPEIEKKNKKLFLLGGFVFVMTVLITTGIGYFILNLNDAQRPTQENKEVVVKPSPTPEAKKIDRSIWKFEVLNGSGVTGAASEASDTLKELGYEVEKIGNADEVDDSELYVSETMSDEDIDLLLDDLSKDFGKLTVTGELKDNTSNVRLILGPAEGN